MDFITIPLVVGTITLGIYKLFELFVRRKERLTLIDKMNIVPNHELLNELSNFPISKPLPAFGTLKAACLLLGIGLGLLTGFLIIHSGTYSFAVDDSWGANETKSIVYGSCVLIFGGLGLLVAFLIEQKITKK